MAEFSAKSAITGSAINSIEVEWDAPAHIRAFTTTRNGGESKGVYDSFNLALHVNDQAEAVISNRNSLKQNFELPAEPCWLNQTHSNRVIKAQQQVIEADASWTQNKNTVCAVLTADCLPVFFTDRAGSRVAVAHAGWRGLLNGVISATFSAMQIEAEDCLVWLGPAIGPEAFETGAEVRQSFIENHQESAQAFKQTDARHWMCDIYQLARIELGRLGVRKVSGGNRCTYNDKENFYSYRRSGETGRMASLIWIND